MVQQLQTWTTSKPFFHSDNAVAMLSKKVLVCLKLCSRGLKEDGPFAATAEVSLNRVFNLPDFLGVGRKKEAPFVPRVAFLTLASLSLSRGVWDSIRDLRCNLLSPSEC